MPRGDASMRLTRTLECQRRHVRSRAQRSRPVDAIGAVTWLQRDSGHPLRVPIGVIGPRDATPAQIAAAFEVGERLARRRLRRSSAAAARA